MRTVSLTAILLFIILHCFAQTDSTTGVFDFVEQMPEFPGGNAALVEFMKENLVTPPKMGEGCGGDRYAKVEIGFVVDVNGSINNITVLDSAGPLYNQEAVQLVKSFPNFKPGYKNGKPVKVHLTLPVIFGHRKGSGIEY